MAASAQQSTIAEPVAVPDADREAAERLGVALKVLRTRSGLNQTEAASRLSVSAQAWGQYELGRSSSIFRPSVQRKLAEALGFTAADLAEELSRVAANPVHDYPGLPDARP